jgi:hypothetical protein
MSRRSRLNKTRKRSNERSLRQRRSQDYLANRAQYPRFVWKDEGADPGFVALVKTILREFDFKDPHCCDEDMRAYYKAFKLVGGQLVASKFDELRRQRGINYVALTEYSLDHLVKHVINRMSEAKKQHYLVTNTLQMVPDGHDFGIRLWSLEQCTVDGQTQYHSRARPTISIDDQKLVVCFSHHALERIRERTVPEVFEYLPWLRAFGVVDGCRYYEPVVLTNGFPGFTFYIDLANKKYEQDDTYAVWPATIFDQVIGKANAMGQSWYYRVGYCPVVISNGYAIAKTLLFPGFATTPEYDEIRNSPDLTRSQKDQMLEAATHMTAHHLFMNQDFELLTWLQQHGTPQVRPLDGEIFRPTTIP